MKFTKLFLILLLLYPAVSSAFAVPVFCLKGPHRLYLGPEFYYVKRTKEGGSKQRGWLYGGRAEYERRLHGGLYYAVEGAYACGDLKGKTSSGNRLESDLIDREIEGRLGYAFCFPRCKKLTVVPYGGYGYFKTTNDFKKPSPLVCTFHDSFNYGAAGVEVSLTPCPCWEWGIDFKAKFMTEGKSRVKDDPDFDDFTLVIDSETQYEVDIPVRYYGCLGRKRISAVISPFYRLRHLGGMANWPFDFIETKFHNYGAKLLLNIFF